MRSLVPSLILALLVGVAASCAGGDSGSSTDAAGCSPGQQVSCACPGGGDPGVQVCDAAGIGYGVCMGCDDATGSSDASSVGDDATTGVVTTDAMTVGSSGPADGSEVTGPPGGSESGGDAFAWVWVDHGGPAFFPPACAATAGVADGLLVDPQTFFNALVGGADPDDWVAVMNSIEAQLWGCGVGQQRGSDGTVRGRLFLPTEACPNSAPPADDPEAMFLGVRQEEACWAHPVDVVSEL